MINFEKKSFFILDRYSSNFTVDLLPGDSYASFKVFLLAVPSDSRERRGLAQVSLYRILKRQYHEIFRISSE
jgi:hypothetical protein